MYEFSWILVYEFVIIRLQLYECVCMSLHEFLCMHIVWACTHGINKKREIEDPTVWTKKNCVLFPLLLCLSVTHYLSLFLCVLLPSIYLFLSPSLSNPLSLSLPFSSSKAQRQLQDANCGQENGKYLRWFRTLSPELQHVLVAATAAPCTQNNGVSSSSNVIDFHDLV